MARKKSERFTEQPTVPMTARMLQALDHLATDRRIPRTELMRRLLDEGLTRQRTENENGQRDGVAA